MIQNIFKEFRERVLVDESGFTLIEMFVALTIFSIVGLATFSLMKNAMVARTATKRATAQLMQTRQLNSMLVSDLASVQNFSLGPFKGNQDSLSFTVLEEMVEGESVLKYVSYSTKRDQLSEDKIFFRSVQDFDNASTRKVKKVLTNMESIELQYLKQEKNEVHWVEHWSETGEVPLAIQIKIFLSTEREPLQVTSLIRTYRNVLETSSNDPVFTE